MDKRMFEEAVRVGLFLVTDPSIRVPVSASPGVVALAQILEGLRTGRLRIDEVPPPDGQPVA